MKTKTSIGMAILASTLGFALVGGHYALNANADEEATAETTNTVTAPETNVPPVKTVLESTLPADVNPDSPFAQLVRMVQAGVDKEVILAYIKQSPRFFELDADDIIYLTDIGTPPDVIQAALKRDEQLIEQGIGAGKEKADPEPESAAMVEDQPPEVTVAEFHDALSPYGTWVYIEGYGRCWRPTVVIHNSSWQPYCDNGYWIYTDRGWHWKSNYSWGWATFHYGRWFHHAGYGWCWWPDTVWAPSWVHWRYSSSYCGWAPLPPHTVYRPGIGLVYRGSRVSVGFGFDLSHHYYTFVSSRHFCDRDLRRHRVPRHKIEHVYSTTRGHVLVDLDQRKRIINEGIPAQQIAAATSRDIKPVSIRYRTNHAGRGRGYESLDQSRQSIVVNQPVTKPRKTIVKTAPSTVKKAEISQQGSKPQVSRPATTPIPSRSTSSRKALSPRVSTPQTTTPPAVRKDKSTPRPKVNRPSRPEPQVRPSTPNPNTKRSTQGGKPNSQVRKPRAGTPSTPVPSQSYSKPKTSNKEQAPSSRSESRSQPKTPSSRPSQVRSRDTSSRSSAGYSNRNSSRSSTKRNSQLQQGDGQ